MKAFYSWLLVVSVIVLLCSLSLPSSHGWPVQRVLLHDPDGWSISIQSSDSQLGGQSPETTKAWLLRFLRRNENDLPEFQNHLIAANFCLASIVFSVIGILRERHLAKTRVPAAPP
jgi:hypothetical protein